MTKRVLALLLVAMVAVVVVAGCGSDDDSSDSAANSSTNASASEQLTVATNSLTKAQFIDQAETVCREVRQEMGKEVEAYGRKLGESQSEEATLAVTQDSILIPGVVTHIEKLSELGAPEGEKAEVEAMLEAMQEGVEIAERTPVEEFIEFGDLFRSFDALARKYGLDGCVFD